MASRFDRLIERMMHRRFLRRWKRAADHAPDADLEDLRRWRWQARAERNQIDRLLHEAEHRLALPLIGSNVIRKPWGTDWAWRPDPWRGPIATPGMAAAPDRCEIAPGLTIFHDCRRSELSYLQLRNDRAADVAPYGLRMDVFRFDGTYLSLALDLPESACLGLRATHLIRVDLIAQTEKPLEMFARLNVKHGPNVEQVVRELPLREAEVMAEFDLAYTRIDDRRIERMWLDLIFEGPEMNEIILRDVTLTRRPRAEL